MCMIDVGIDNDRDVKQCIYIIVNTFTVYIISILQYADQALDTYLTNNIRLGILAKQQMRFPLR